MPIFGSSKKTPAEIIKSFKEALTTLERGDDASKKTERANDEVIKQITNIKSILFGSTDQEPNSELIMAMHKEILDQDMIASTIKSLTKLDFESKKEFVLILAFVLKRQVGSKTPCVEYLLDAPNLMTTIVDNYANGEISLNIGMILRECIKYPKLTMRILNSPELGKIFAYIDSSSFDLSSDAFLTFKEIMTRHKDIVVAYLDANFDQFFTSFHKLLKSDNYVTKRQSTKLLGELLVERQNSNTLIKYASNPEYLKLIMGLLKDKSQSVQFEAFHVFKIFVVTPNRCTAILDILCKNKALLIEYLLNFQNDRKDDEQFIDEKEYVIRQIKDLPS